MNTTELLSLVVDTLEENKAVDIAELNVSALTDTVDAMIVCTATSTRHAKSLAQKVVDQTKQSGIRPFGVEGETYGEWILIDLSDIIVHIMLAEQREFYNLEKLWTATEQTRKKSAQTK